MIHLYDMMQYYNVPSIAVLLQSYKYLLVVKIEQFNIRIIII